MQILHYHLEKHTRGFTDIVDITSDIKDLLARSAIQNGLVTIFVPGSTGAITTIEYEPGLLEDLPEIFESIIPQQKRYHHDRTWGDGNGFAHLRAALLGPSLSVPVQNGKLQLGTWQQIIFLDFDNRPRHRSLTVQLIGE